MKTIQIDDDLYQFIAANTQKIGESASDILRRLLWENTQSKQVEVTLQPSAATTSKVSSADNDNVSQVSNQPVVDSSLKVDAPNTIVETAPLEEPETEDDHDQVLEPSICKDTTVFNLLNKEEVATQKGAVGRFLFILGKLHRAHNSNFNNVLEIKGRERNYFGLSASELEASGSSIKPKQIPNSEYWVTTNNNTPRKKFIIFEVAKHLGYEETDAEKLRELI